MTTLEHYTGFRREGLEVEVDLAMQNKATCGYCGEIVPQERGFATARRGFWCFDCALKGETERGGKRL